MKKYNLILTEKQQKYHRHCQLSFDKYEYVTGEEKLLFDQSRIIEQLKLTYSPLGKASEKLTKKIGDQGKKQKKI